MPATFQHLELLSRQVHQAHRAAVEEELTLRGLRDVNPLILAILKHIARTLGISPAAVTNSLKTMENSGYVIRKPEQEDARRNRVELTRKGREAVEGCEEAFLTVSQRMLAGFTAEEQAMLVDFRARMLNNLRMSGVLGRLGGVIIGQFTDCDNDPTMQCTLQDSIREILADYDYPIIWDAPYGHIDENRPIMLSQTT